MNLQERFEELKRFVCMNQAHEFDTIVSILEELDDGTQLIDVLMRCVELIKYMRLDNYFGIK